MANVCAQKDTRRGQNNADGFGIGFYTDPKLGPAPCVFTSTIPAWNCTNLQRIASKTASRLIFGHVRATTEGSLSEDNCHPFTHGSLMWMHNGGLGGWKHIKRRLGALLNDKWYLEVKGGTDSEWAFALFLNTLERHGYDPSACPETGFGPTVLRKAVEETIAQINELTDSIPQSVLQNEDVDTRSLLNFAVTDGHSTICTRYISSAKDEAASLYYSSGTQWVTRTSDPNDRQYQMERKDKGADIVLVASEPLTFERGRSSPVLQRFPRKQADSSAENWVNVPTNSILTIHRQTVMVHPILDKYYDRDPAHVRSSAFVQANGLVSNEKSLNGPLTPATEHTGSLDMLRKQSRSISPDLKRRSLGRDSCGLPYRAPANGLGLSSANSRRARGSQQDGDGHAGPTTLSEEKTSDSDEPIKNSSGNTPKKLSQYFPELALTSHAS